MPPRRAKKANQAQDSRLAQKPAQGLGGPPGVGQALRGLLGQRVRAVVDSGALDRDQAEELAKIGALLEKLEQGGYDLKAAAVEVGGRLVDLLDAFYFHLDQGA